MPRTSIFSQIQTVKHPRQVMRIEPRALSAATAGGPLGGLSSDVSRLIRSYPLPHVGTQTYAITVPSNLSYDGSSVITLPPSSPGAIATVEKQPPNGATGSQALEVKYTIPPGGMVRYRTRAYARMQADPSAGNQEPEYEVLYVIDSQSVERLSSLMQSKQRIILAIQGDDAVKLVGTGLFNPGQWKLKTGPFGVPQVEINPTWEWVAIAAILAVAAVAAFLLIVLETMVIMGILHGYRVEVRELSLGTLQIGNMTIEASLPTLAFVLEPA